MEVPDTLARKMELFKARGQFVKYSWEMFSPASWLAIYSGFDFFPDGYDPGVDAIDADYLREVLREMRQSIADAVTGMPSHEAFIASLRAGPAQPAPKLGAVRA